jgi:hypothetical protein
LQAQLSKKNRRHENLAMLAKWQSHCISLVNDWLYSAASDFATLPRGKLNREISAFLVDFGSRADVVKQGGA